jgi:predicted lactoylglutathione lyase
MHRNLRSATDIGWAVDACRREVVDAVYMRGYFGAMATSIFVNLPVKDLDRSIEFFTKLGYTFNAELTDENATSMIISDNIYAMLLVEDYFKTFTSKQIADTSACTESIIALSVDGRAEVDELVGKAIAAGATSTRQADDYGYMYTRSFEDLDGHLWEVVWMDSATVHQPTVEMPIVEVPIERVPVEEVPVEQVPVEQVPIARVPLVRNSAHRAH